MVGFQPLFTAVGGNRHPAAADWNGLSALLAFGAGNNVAIWSPLNRNSEGVTHLLKGHTNVVNAVKFFPSQSRQTVILSGSVDKTIRIWAQIDPDSFKCISVLQSDGSVNCFAVAPGLDHFISASTDASITVWSVTVDQGCHAEAKVIQTIRLKPRYFALTLALNSLHVSNTVWILAVAGTKTVIQLFIGEKKGQDLIFHQQASLSGHEGWIRSLSFTRDIKSSELLLSSSSQDKYVRLWRICEASEIPKGSSLPLPKPSSKTLSNRAHRLITVVGNFVATFEALLLGHDDWIYSAQWCEKDGTNQLLTASADNTLSVWEADESTGVWVPITRLGEVSAQKGATTATGSAGGYWIGLWSPDGQSIATLGKTGSWRLWSQNPLTAFWTQNPAISGHTKAVKSLAWSTDGDYLLSTGSDQTSRLFAEWKRDSVTSWHEFSRPQIHGYDLNCLDTFSHTSFVSGADEKLLRVFDMPKSLAKLLQKLCSAKGLEGSRMPETADMPVLGLSNKAIEHDDGNNDEDADPTESKSAPYQSSLLDNLIHPPLEDNLSKSTLWPEREKLYGHGYEISCLATTTDHTLIATACRASSLDHAVIRLFRTDTWSEVKPPLKAHTLTVTKLRFSPDDKYLLSVGRDRQWALFERAPNDPYQYNLTTLNPKGHSRMILDAAWAPSEFTVSGGHPGEDAGFAFVTAGRDKAVRLWKGKEGEKEVVCLATYQFDQNVCAVDFAPRSISGNATLAVGLEDGLLKIAALETNGEATWHTIDTAIAPSATINQLSWRPSPNKAEHELAVASEDHSVRIYSIDLTR